MAAKSIVRAILALGIAAIAGLAHAQTDGPPTTPLAGTEPIRCLQGGSYRACTPASLAAFATNSINPLGADPLGVSDSSPAFVALATSGAPATCEGEFKTSTGILITEPADSGAILSGSGPEGDTGQTAGRCTIFPEAGVTTSAIYIDGSTFTSGGVYQTSTAIRDLGIDLFNDPGAAGIEFGQSFDESVTNVRVSDGAWNECSFKFDDGNYVTSLKDVQGQYICWNGDAADAPTTETIINADVYGISGSYADDVAFIGGAIQPAYNASMTLVYLPPNDPRTPSALVNTTGLYAIQALNLTNSIGVSFKGTDIEARSGFPSTCTGTHGTLSCFPAFVVDSTDKNFLFENGLSGMYLVDTRTPGDSQDCTNQFGYNLGGGAPADLFQCPVYFRNAVVLSGGQSFFCETNWATTNTCVLNAANGDLKLYPQGSAYGLEVYEAGSTTNLSASITRNSVNVFNCLSGNAENVFSDNGGTVVATLGCWQNDANAGSLQLYNPSNSNLNISISAINGVIRAPSYWLQIGGSGYGGNIVFTTSLTTTAASSDSVTLGPVSSSSHCLLYPTNASAATNIATTYVSAKTTGALTVNHNATAGMTLDVVCSAY
jgi:hypothetical protein